MFRYIKKHGAANLRLGVPVMLGHFGHMMVGVSDSIMVGHTGAVPLAAASFANSVFIIVMVFCIGVTYAITPLVAHANGHHDLRTITQVFKHGLVINVAIGIFLSLIMVSNAGLLSRMGQDEAVLKQALPYFIVISFSLIPFMVFQSLKQTCEGMGHTTVPMVLAIIANVVNIALNYVLIFGKFGVEPMGLYGAGISTLISRVIQAVLLGGYLLFHQKYEQFRGAFSFDKWSYELFKKLVLLGAPIGLQVIFEVSTFSLAAIMIGWLGVKQLAAHQIAISMVAITYMLALGLSTATTIRVSNALGRKKYGEMYHVAVANYGLIIIMMAAGAVLFIVGRHFLPGLYIKDPEVIELASSLIIIAGLFQISDGVQVNGLSALRGMSDVNIPTIITLIAYWGIGLPLGYFLGFNMGMDSIGIWVGLLLSLTIAALLLFLRFRYVVRKLKSS